jgi:subtilisin-like proprotein convertase family protein
VRRSRLARVYAAAIVALATTALIAAPASAKKAKTYSSGAINAAIPDASFPGSGGGGVGSVTDTTRVKGKGKVKDVNVSVRITHPYDRDLELWLMSPSRTIVKLVARHGGDGNDFGAGATDCNGTPMVLDDQAPAPISAGGAPFADSFVPDEPLSALNGGPARGSWTLLAIDAAPGDAGTLHCWELTVASKGKKH